MVDKRESLKIGRIYTLEQADGKGKKDFKINKEIGRGGSCIVYEAEYHIDEKSEAVKAILKEYYPRDNSNNYDVKRQSDGTLLINDGSREKFEEKKEKFFEGFYRQIEFQNKNTILSNSIVFGMEKFFANNTEYILMARDEGNSFDECKFSFDNENNNIKSNFREFSLYQTINTIYEFSKIVEQLHKEGFLLLDIKPDNMYVTLKDEVKLFDFDSFKRKDNLLNEAISSSNGWEAPEVKGFYTNLEKENFTGAKRKLSEIDERADFYSIGQLLSYKVFGIISQDADSEHINNHIEELKKDLFKEHSNINYEIFGKLQQFFKKTITAKRNARYKNDNELVNALEELKNLANPQNRFLNYRIENPSAYADYRDKELEQLHNILQNYSSAFVSAIGGMGKSELAKMYIQKYKNEYDIIQFVNYSDSMEDTIRKISVSGLEAKLTENPNLHYQVVSNLLDEQTGDILLIIDNFDSEAKDINLLAYRKNIKVIFTTRLDIKKLYNEYTNRLIELNPLSNEDCENFFCKLYDEYNESELLEIREIIRTVNKNTLVVKLIAMQMQEQATEAAEILERLKTADVHNLDGEVFYNTEYNILYAHLLTVFNMADFDDDIRLILLKMSIVPFIYKKDIKEWFDEKNLNGVNRLKNRGWIEYDENERKFSLHPIISILAYEEMYESSWQKCESVVNGVSEFIKDFKELNDFEKRKELTDFAEYSINRMKKDSLEYSYFYHNYAVIQNIQGEYGKALEFYFKSLEIGEEILGENSLDVAVLYNNIGLVYKDQGEYGKALEFYFKSLEIGEGILGENSLSVSDSYNNIGVIYDNQGEYDKALEFYFKSLEIGEGILGENSLNVAGSYNNIGLIYKNQGEYGKALEFCFKSLDIRKRILGENSLPVSDLYNNIGLIYDNQGEYDKALKFYFKSLEIGEGILGENSLNVAGSYNNIGLVYKNQGEYGKALEFCFKSLDIRKRILGENSLDVAGSYNNIGLIYDNQGEYDKALELYFKSLEIEEGILGENSLPVSDLYNNIGYVYEIQGEYGRALGFYFKSLEISKEILGENSLDVAGSYNNIGCVYDSQGEYNKALEFYFKSLDIREGILGENSLDVAGSYNNIGCVYDSQGEYNKALEFYFKSLDIRKRILGENSLPVAGSYNNIGCVYDSQGEYNKALEFYFKSLEIKKYWEIYC